MYNTPLSDQWILDVCMTGSVIWFILALPIIGLFFFYFLLRKSKLGRSLSIAFSFAVLICIYIFYIPAYLLGGFTVCRPDMFFRGIVAAHPIHAVIKEKIRTNQDVPKSIEDIKDINPEQFKIMSENAKVNYIYDEKNKTYTFFVRPSRYLVAIFDSKNDFKIYSLDKSADQRFNPEKNFYPPSYLGPWDKLPK